jgi:hypothetical protein
VDIVKGASGLLFQQVSIKRGQNFGALVMTAQTM